jgi:23S rRNA pseudouridine1911/1915/1917 synthase
MKRLFVVDENEAGQRVDVWLSKKSGLSRSVLKRALDAGDVRVNGKKVYIAGWKLAPRNRVELRERAPTKGGPGVREKSGGFVKIIYDDRDIIVVDKPAGILSVAHEGGACLEDRIRAYLRRKYKSASYLKPVHRLDTDTSGAIVYAKSKAGERLEELFRHHDIDRGYLAVVSGPMTDERGRIDAPLEKGDFAAGRKVRASKSGREAVTEYEVKERYPNATLLQVKVLTGRTHQIRVHLANIGHPIIGDKLYGGGALFWRQALHAHRLGFKHPATGKKMRFESPLPKDMRELIDKLRGV